MHHQPKNQESREPINGEQLRERRRQMRLHLMWLLLSMARRPDEMVAVTYGALDGRASTRKPGVPGLGTAVDPREVAARLRRMAKGAEAAGGKELPEAMRRAADALSEESKDSKDSKNSKDSEDTTPPAADDLD